MVETIIAMDPEAPGLGRRERYRRSLKLLEVTLAATEKCGTNNELKDKAVRMLRARTKSYSEETEAAVSLARALWAERVKLCGAAAPADGALSGAIALVSP